jgi:hypothetical protein
VVQHAQAQTDVAAGGGLSGTLEVDHGAKDVSAETSGRVSIAGRTAWPGDATGREAGRVVRFRGRIDTLSGVGSSGHVHAPLGIDGRRTMRLTPLFSASVVVLGALSVGATDAVGQAGPTDEHARLEKELGDGLFAAPSVTGAPFAAEAVTTWRPPAGSGRPEQSATSRTYRDRAGRVRVEQTFAGQPAAHGAQRIFVLADPQRRSAYLIDPVGRTVVEVPPGLANMSTSTPATLVLPVAMRCVISFTRPQTMHQRLQGGYAEEPLGQRMVLGVPAAGSRFAPTLAWPIDSVSREMADERWVSLELGIVLHSRSLDPAIGVVEHLVTRLSQAEPSPRLFDIPADYRLGESLWPAGWENPHALVTRRRGAEPCSH